MAEMGRMGLRKNMKRFVEVEERNRCRPGGGRGQQGCTSEPRVVLNMQGVGSRRHSSTTYIVTWPSVEPDEIVANRFRGHGFNPGHTKSPESVGLVPINSQGLSIHNFHPH